MAIVLQIYFPEFVKRGHRCIILTISTTTQYCLVLSSSAVVSFLCHDAFSFLMFRLRSNIEESSRMNGLLEREIGYKRSALEGDDNAEEELLTEKCLELQTRYKDVATHFKELKKNLVCSQPFVIFL